MNRSKELPVYVSLEEAAHIMSLSTRTIRRRISDGTIPPTNAASDPSASASTNSKPPYAASPQPDGDPPLSQTLTRAAVLGRHAPQPATLPTAS